MNIFPFMAMVDFRSLDTHPIAWIKLWRRLWSSFPVEVIGNLLSRLEDARDVVIASFTCRKWREAWRNHLHKLTFNSDDWPVCDEHMTHRFEVIITQIIFQTNALQCLSITMKKDVVLSAAPVIAWLLYTRETLRQLHFSVNTPNLNILEKCGHQRLELLDLAEITISRVEFSYQKFSCLRSLSLDHFTISALDLSCLVTACLKVEVLNLVCLDFDGPLGTMKLRSNSLKDIHVQGIHSDDLNEIILDTDSLEKLQIKNCDLGIFKLLSKGMLRLLEMDDIYSFPLGIGENAKNLEILEVSNSITWRSSFHHMISKLSNVRRMSLCYVTFEDDVEVVDINSTSACFSLLSHLSLTYELRDSLQCGLLGYSQLENVVVLELGWEVITDLFSHWVAELLERCPNLRKLVIHGAVSRIKTQEECHTLANFTSFIVKLMGKYLRVDVQLKYV